MKRYSDYFYVTNINCFPFMMNEIFVTKKSYWNFWKQKSKRYNCFQCVDEINYLIVIENLTTFNKIKEQNSHEYKTTNSSIKFLSREKKINFIRSIVKCNLLIIHRFLWQFFFYQQFINDREILIHYLKFHLTCFPQDVWN